MMCDICNSKETYVKDYEHIYEFKGKKIKFIAPRRFCSNCNNFVYYEELDHAVGLKAIDLYNKKYGIPKDEIINLRKQYSLSQELFSKIIGCAKKTLISYEKGTSIPNDNFMIILKSLIKNPSMILEIVDSNKELFTDKEYQKINKNVSAFVDLDNKNELDEYNGYTKRNHNKIVNLILMICNKGILKTKLLKEMFYADFLNYKNTGTSITGLCYAKIDHGPVPDNYETLINRLCKDNIIDYIVTYQNDYEYHNIIGKKDVDTSVFNEEELNTINSVINFFEKYTSRDIEKFSHEEVAFKQTKFYDNMSYDYAFDIERIK